MNRVADKVFDVDAVITWVDGNAINIMEMYILFKGI